MLARLSSFPLAYQTRRPRRSKTISGCVGQTHECGDKDQLRIRQATNYRECKGRSTAESRSATLPQSCARVRSCILGGKLQQAHSGLTDLRLSEYFFYVWVKSP